MHDQLVDQQHTYMCETFNDLQVVTVSSLDGPAPALVCALSRSTYTVSGDNSPTVPVNMFDMF